MDGFFSWMSEGQNACVLDRYGRVQRVRVVTGLTIRLGMKGVEISTLLIAANNGLMSTESGALGSLLLE